MIKYIFGLENEKYLPLLSVLLFMNSTNYSKVDTSEINQNSLIAKINMPENIKISKIDKKKKQTIIKN